MLWFNKHVSVINCAYITEAFLLAAPGVYVPAGGAAGAGPAAGGAGAGFGPGGAGTGFQPGAGAGLGTGAGPGLGELTIISFSLNPIIEQFNYSTFTDVS